WSSDVCSSDLNSSVIACNKSAFSSILSIKFFTFLPQYNTCITSRHASISNTLPISLRFVCPVISAICENGTVLFSLNTCIASSVSSCKICTSASDVFGVASAAKLLPTPVEASPFNNLIILGNSNTFNVLLFIMLSPCYRIIYYGLKIALIDLHPKYLKPYFVLSNLYSLPLYHTPYVLTSTFDGRLY